MKPPNSIVVRYRRAPLRRQLMLAFSALSIASTAIATLSVASFASHRLHQDLRDKSIHYARQLQRQLEPVIAYDDRVTAQEAFASMIEDKDVDDLGVYDQSGQLLEGRGVPPEKLASIDASVESDAAHVVAVADIQSRDGHKGRVYVRLNSMSIDAATRRNSLLAAAIAAGVALCALVLAAAISQWIARRLERIGQAVKLIAAGQGQRVVLQDSAQDAIGDLALAFNTMVHELDRLSQEHQRLVNTERERLEQLVSERTLALEQSREMFRLIAESTLAVPFTLDLASGAFPYIGAQGMQSFRIPEARWARPGALEVALPRESHEELRNVLDLCESGPFEFMSEVHYPGDRLAELRWTGTCEKTVDKTILRGLMQDVTEGRRLARELRAAQKLESLGRLAAGVAHEINTPVQFVVGNVEFVTQAMAGIVTIIEAYRGLKEAIQSSRETHIALHYVEEAETKEDLSYLLDNTRPALDGAMEGLKRIAGIVRSMKEFAHPDQSQKSAADLNHAIETTLVIARNEYKYVADVVTDFHILPTVECYLGEINQVILNLLVNAGHAIADAAQGLARGTITIRTRVVGQEVEISIGDTGNGIPVAARDKIFDPFFTTKEVGRGTGQGLAIARSVIVNKHGGSLRFETETGKGTTFFVRLPINAATSDAEHLAA